MREPALRNGRGGDQAAGLRRLLRPAALRVLPVAGGRDGTERAGIVVNLAAAAASDGYAVVVLDQSRGEVARAMGLKPRYELIHLLEGERKFSDVALEGHDGLRVLSAARGMAALAAQDGQAQSLFGAFAQIERPADLVIVNIDDPGPAGALLPVGEGEVLLVATPAAESVTGAYSHIKQLANTCGVNRFRLLVGDVPPAGDPQTVAKNMAEVARRFLSARLTYGGCIPRDPQLQRSVRMQMAVIRSAPDSVSARAFRNIAASMAQWDSFEISAPRVEMPARAACPPAVAERPRAESRAAGYAVLI